MKDEQINIAIAKTRNVCFERRTVCPWCNGNTPYEAGDDYGITLWAECENCSNTGEVEPYYVGIQDYCNDLNAMHEAWEALTLIQKRQFETELYRVIICDGDYNRNDDAMKITNATARQRARAFLKTLGLWDNGSA